jgi:hypothetical protein
MVPLSSRGSRVLKSGAGVLVGLSIVGTAWVHAGATEAAHELLDSRWRGAYDILVTAEDERAQIVGDAGDALPPYAIATARSRLTMGDLERIRAVPDVDVAAPVGDVLIRPRADGPRVMYQVPLSSSRDDEVHALRVSLSLTVGKERERRSLRHEEYALVLDLSGGASQVGVVGDEIVSADDCVTSEDADLSCHLVHRVPVTWAPVDEPANVAQSSGYLSDNRLLFELPTLIETYPRILFVDPAAERRLLGDAGDFLAPLSVVVPDFSVADLQRANSDPAFPAQRDEVGAWLRSVPQSDASGERDRERLVMPIVVASDSDLDATLTITVDTGFDAPTVAPDSGAAGIIAWRFPADLLSGRARDQREASSFDASSLIASADPKTAIIPLPGFDGRDHLAAAPPSLTRVREWAFTTPVRPRASGDRLSLAIDEYLTPSAAESVDTPAGRWLAFDAHARSGSSEPVAHEVVETSAVAEGQGPLLVAVSEVSLSAPTNATASSVPLATVDGTDTRIRADDGATSQRVPPSFSGMGLSSTRPTAFANIASAELLGMRAPISSVRVRVAGVSDGYTPENLTQVQRVVERLRSSGYHAVMVAGSSRASVAIDVHGYPSTADHDRHTHGEILPVTIQQEWSELGAVSRVDTVVTHGNQLFALISVLCGVLLFVLLMYAELPARRHTATVLNTLGWTRGSIHRAFWREDLLAIALICTGAVVGAVAASVTNSGPYTVPTHLATALCAIAFVGAPGAAWLGIRLTTTASSRSPRRRRPWRDCWRFGLSRCALAGAFFAARDARTLILTAAPVLLAALATGGATVLANSIVEGSGKSDIAALVVDRIQVAHALLACTGLIAAAGLLLATAKMLSAQLRARAGVLQQCGWTRTQRRLARMTEVASATVPSTAIATLSTWGLAAGSSPGGLVPAAMAASTGLVATMILAGSKEKR